MAQNIEVVKNTPKAMLGEGPIWHPLENVLYWIDISGMKLHRYDPIQMITRTFDMGSMIGTVVPAKHPYSVVVALETGIYAIDVEGKRFKLTSYPDDEMCNNRFNDGKCDPAGCLWVGTMNKNVVQDAGHLYCFDGQDLIVKQSGVTISNGIAWSTDAKTMYYIDTPDFVVYAFDYDLKTGTVSNKRVVITIAEDLGAPDGMTIDSEGMLWIAHWGGSAVIRWNPISGQIMEKIEVPAPHVTSCTFGGGDLQTLYITTARDGLSKKEFEMYPLSGALFKIHTTVKGVSANVWNKDVTCE